MNSIVLRGSVFDGKEFAENMEILLDSDSGIISAYGERNSIDVPAGATEIEAEGTIMPGFTDAHLHFFGSRKFDFREWTDTDPIVAALRSVKDARNLLMAGFTTVRDLGSKCAIQLRKSILEEDIIGPDIIPAGRSIAATGGDDDQKVYPLEIAQRFSYSSYCDGPWDCVRAARREIRDGAMTIKVYSGDRITEFSNKPFLKEGEIRAITEEAHSLGVRVTAHAYGEEGIRAAVNAGVDSIEHGFGLTEELAGIMVAKGIYLVPTVAVHAINEKYMSGKWKEMTEAHMTKDIPMALEQGVLIALGTDFVGCDTEPHGGNYIEMKYLNKSGLSIQQSLQAATSNGAGCLGLKDRGVLAQGMRADIVVSTKPVNADLENIRPEMIAHVIKKGKIIK